jgi:DNA polymerase II small subunit
MVKELDEKGIRLSVEAEQLLNESGDPELVQRIIALNKPLVGRADMEPLLAPKKEEPKVEVRGAGLIPLAKEYAADIKVIHTKDVTGKSRTKGETENFINYFRNRYQRTSRMLHSMGEEALMDLKDAKSHVNERVLVHVMVSSKQETKKGNLMLEIEDMTGSFKAIISGQRDEKLAEKAKSILVDDVIALTGKVLEPYMIVNDVEWPDFPVTRKELKRGENDLAIAYLSDTHFGSKYFLEKEFKAFVDWMHGRGEARELAAKVKYILVAGDLVDGIGIYPNQEKELVVKDIYQQYRMFDDFVESLPDWVEVIVSPGNHDAVRRGEPMPAIGKDLLKSDVTSVGNPSSVVVEGLKHLVYHATSIDSMISNLPNASYMHPEKVMVEYLKRRNLSPIYGGNLIIPENIDYMVIDDEPDVLHCGHVHKNGYTQYRGTLLINSGTFQDRTEYQVKQGHVPTPAMVPVYEMKSNRLRTLDFRSG